MIYPLLVETTMTCRGTGAECNAKKKYQMEQKFSGISEFPEKGKPREVDSFLYRSILFRKFWSN